MKRAAALACLALASSAFAEPPSAPPVLAGFGSAPLPIPSGGVLGGYGGLVSRRASAALDPPEARALVLERGALRIALVTLDIVIARPNLRDPILEAAEGLGLDLVLVVATHTHSGPGGYLEGFAAERLTAGQYDPEAAPRLARAAGDALERALADLRPAELSSALVPTELARNRRVRGGPRDDRLGILYASRGKAAAPIALVSIGAHGTLLPAFDSRYSADWPGALRDELEARGVHALFVPGALGDQEPAIDRLDDPDDAATLRAFGKRAAEAALTAFAELRAPATPELAALERWVEPPPRELRRFCALWWISPLLSGSLERFVSKRVPLQLVRAGGAELIAIPVEPSAAVGAALRTRAGSDRTPLLVAHANDWLGYAVDRTTYDAGSYEACLSFNGPELASWLVLRIDETRALLDARTSEEVK